MHNAEIFADVKKVKKTKRADTRNKVSHVVINLLGMSSYFAPRRAESILTGIGEELHPEQLEKHNALLRDCVRLWQAQAEAEAG